MRRLSMIVAAVALAPAAHTQTQVDLRTQSKGVDFTAASTTKPLKSGTALPASCGAGEMFWKTNAPAGANVYGCTATNTWTVQGSTVSLSLGGDLTGTVSSATVVRLQGRPVAATAPASGQALVWNATNADWEPQTVAAGTSSGPVQGAQFASGLGDFAAGRLSNTQVSIAANSGGTAVRCGNAVTIFTGAVVITAGPGSLNSGAALYPYIDCTASPAAIRVDTSSAVVQSRLTVTGATLGNSSATGYPADAIPLPRITGGTTQDQFDASFTDVRGFLSTTVVRCGANLSRTANADGSYTCAVDPTSSLSWSGAADLSGATFSRVNRMAGTDPATCTEGESYYNSTSHQRKDCIGTNQWQASGGLLTLQPGTSPVAVSTGDTIVYSYTLPAGAIQAGGCITVEAAWQTSAVGTGAVTPKAIFGGTSVALYTANSYNDRMAASLDICNMPGSVTRQQIDERALVFSSHTASGFPNYVSASENTQQPVTLSLAVNGAGSSGFTVSGLWLKVTRN